MVAVWDLLTCAVGHIILLSGAMAFSETEWKKWIKANKHMTIASVADKTNPNHTGGELTEDN
jgi:hypothetical protein